MDTTLLQNRDYTIIIAKTALNEANKPPGFTERWAAAQSSILALAQACEAHDPDGITLYVSCSAPEESCLFKKYEYVTSSHLTQVIQENLPPRQINLCDVLQLALEDYFGRKVAGKAKVNGEIVIVLLDGEPSDRMAVAKVIKDATQKMEVNEELGIGFVQIGEDLLAKGFLTALDDHLQSVGAKFDIVHTKLLDTISPDSLTEFLLDTLYD
jgi:hypothetical protein